MATHSITSSRRHGRRPPGSRRLILFNKPYLVLSQFTDQEGRQTLAGFIPVPKVRPAGRLDYDSEGLLLLTDDGALQTRIADPQHKLPKTYWVQVEGEPTEATLAQLRAGIMLDDRRTLPAGARIIAEPDLWPRDPPIRFRKNIPTTWIELTLTEGRNRQVRRMTAAVGHPTLRLVRMAIGPYRIEGLAPGEWREVATGPSLDRDPRLSPVGEADPALVQSHHDLEAKRGGRSDGGARRPVSAGRGRGRGRGRAQPAGRTSR